MNTIIRHVGGYRWDGVPVLNYKEEGSHFKAISRQVLFEGGPKLARSCAISRSSRAGIRRWSGTTTSIR